jgi:hypothetical protein
MNSISHMQSLLHIFLFIYIQFVDCKELHNQVHNTDYSIIPYSLWRVLR